MAVRELSLGDKLLADLQKKNKKKARKKVAIVGFATTTRDQAPYDDEDVEIWSLNESYKYEFVDRETRHFQLHPMWDYMRKSNRNDQRHYDCLKAWDKTPIYLEFADPNIPAGVVYPLNEIEAKFNSGFYYTSTIAYMFALALYEGFNWIGIYGVEMSAGTEYYNQRPCMEYWLGIAKGMQTAGMDVEYFLPPECALLRGTLYGYEDLRVASRTYYEMIKRDLVEHESAAVRKLERMEGRAEQMSVILNLGEDVNRKKIADLVPDLEKERKEALTQANQLIGRRIQTQEYIQWHDNQNIMADRFDPEDPWEAEVEAMKERDKKEARKLKEMNALLDQEKVRANFSNAYLERSNEMAAIENDLAKIKKIKEAANAKVKANATDTSSGEQAGPEQGSQHP